MTRGIDICLLFATCCAWFIPSRPGIAGMQGQPSIYHPDIPAGGRNGDTAR